MLDRVDIAMTPAEALLMPRADAYVVIDALRATTTIAALFARGLRRLTAVTDIEAARAAASAGEVILFGEQGGLRPEGFDYGNSPAEASTLDIAGREAALVTSNGTKALCAVADLGQTVAGSLVNLGAVSELVSRGASVTMVCAGNAGARKFSLEDFAVAAAFVQELQRLAPEANLGDAALLASRVADSAELIGLSEHAGIVRALGFEPDISFAMRRDCAPCVPLVLEYGPAWVVLEDRR